MYFMYLLFLFLDSSHKALDSSEEEFDFDLISWLVTSTALQNISAKPEEPQNPC